MICNIKRRHIGAALCLLMVTAPGSADDVTAQRAIEISRKALDQGDPVTAEIEAQNALDQGAKREDVSALLGQSEFMQGEGDKARRWLEPGKFSDQDWERGFHTLAQLELMDGNPDAAAAAFAKASEKDGGSAALWVDIGRFRYQVGEQRLALAAARTAVKKDPEDPRALEFMGQLARDSEGLRAGLSWFERGTELHPKDIGLLSEYASTLAELGRYKDMLRVTRTILDIQPGNPRAYLLQAVLAARAGENELAQRVFWRTRNSFDNVPTGMLISGVIEQYGGNTMAAANVLENLTRLQPDNIVAHAVLGRALMADDQTGQLTDELGPIVHRKTASPYALTLMGRAFEQAGQRDQAAPYLDRAAGIGLAPPAMEAIDLSEQGAVTLYRWQDEPDRPELVVPTIRQMLQNGQAEAAFAQSKVLLQRYPDSVDMMVLAGDVAALTGHNDQAVKLYQNAALLRFNSQLARRMSYVLVAMNKRLEAKQVLSQYLRGNPNALEAVLLLADLQMADHEWRKADLLLTYARQLAGGQRDAKLLANLSQARLKQGMVEDAVDLATRAYHLQRSGRLPTRALAQAMLAAGRKDEGDVLMAKYQAMMATE
ncbi:tetratricopeptide repeat protein [Altererythrobacter indicus]|uniref:Tetratricopeptide repeat protein n=1 Tax=Altericroceibacterium indicum TaxID=374177 RepID=A0A845AA08_9SPHN|nr:tetratricopeptide repeat protein [Altericroceibacterium indicum]MXP25376.1 tetratricopeptide repeat protein [Altericroceibacterium indicum]